MASLPALEDTRAVSVGWEGASVAPVPIDPPARAVGLVRGRADKSHYRRYGKRLADLIIALSLIIMLSPLIALAAIGALVTSGWPVFYGAERVGRGGRRFRMWKIRTMVRDADAALRLWTDENPNLANAYAVDFKLRDDPRVTRFGRSLRRTSIDELPQLWNVLRGEMSLVGPRPVTEAEIRRYGKNSRTLLSLRPGMSGRWQLDARNQVTYPERMRIELEYCRAPSLARDLRILVCTLIVPFQSSGI